MKYRKRWHELEAIQWTGDNFDEVSDFLESSWWEREDNKRTYLIVSYLDEDGEREFVPRNDWILKRPSGGFDHISPREFDLCYEPI